MSEKVRLSATTASAMAAFNAVVRHRSQGTFLLSDVELKWQFNRTSISKPLGAAMDCAVTGVTDTGEILFGFAARRW